MNPIPIIQGAALTDTLSVLYVAPGNDQQLKNVVVPDVRFHNTSGVDRTVTLHVVPKNGQPTLANARFKDELIPAGMSLLFALGDVILPGGSIQGSASVGGVVVISANGEKHP